MSSAPAKLILCGEHAVVYQRPAIAVPLPGMRAHARVEAPAGSRGLVLAAPDLGRRWTLREHPDEPLSELARATLAALDLAEPDAIITLTSDIPVASGLGSGAAVATALVRALAALAGRTLEPAAIAQLVYASESRYHGTPSGIDNTVVAYEQAIWFQRRPGSALVEPVRLGAALHLVIADTGVRSPTHLPVGEVRRRWQAEPAVYDALFDQVGAVVRRVRALLEAGEVSALGPLLNENQALLVQLGVSSPEIERLVAAARAAGAAGAKLSGAGWGGVVLALCEPHGVAPLQDALQAAGAARVWYTSVR